MGVQVPAGPPNQRLLNGAHRPDSAPALDRDLPPSGDSVVSKYAVSSLALPNIQIGRYYLRTLPTPQTEKSAVP